MLKPEQFPLRIPKLLASKIPPFAACADAIKAATQAGVFSTEAFWMVAEGAALNHLTAVLVDHVIRPTTQTGSPDERVAVGDLDDQILLIHRQISWGWREGLYAPWGIVPRYPSQKYKTHLTKLVRDEREPYRLVPSGPACKVQAKGDTMIDHNKTVDCRGCLNLRDYEPNRYVMVEGTK